MIKILALLIAFLGTVSCSDDSSDESGKDDVKNTIKYGSESYSLTNGLEEVFKLDDNHSSSQINITKLYYTKISILIIYNYLLNYFLPFHKVKIQIFPY